LAKNTIDIKFIEINITGGKTHPRELYNLKDIPDNDHMQLPIRLKNNSNCIPLYSFPRIQRRLVGNRKIVKLIRIYNIKSIPIICKNRFNKMYLTLNNFANRGIITIFTTILNIVIGIVWGNYYRSIT
jgi:hypothetical protein